MRQIATILCLSIAVAIGGCMTAPPETRAPAKVVKMTVTGYCKCGKCCSWRRNFLMMPVISSGAGRGRLKSVGITSSGTRAQYGTIAADISRYPYGTVMYVEGYGYGRVEDTGSAIKGNSIDLFFNTHRRAEDWGRKIMKVKVWPKAGKPIPLRTRK